MTGIALAVVLVLASPAGVMSRLQGHTARVVGDDVVIDDVAGEGKPIVGIVERRGATLWVVGDGVAVELRGPLARPRIAGPGYRVWVLGRRDGDVLVARRLGVLAPPRTTINAAPARD
jgi:hypothetical protein